MGEEPDRPIQVVYTEFESDAGAKFLGERRVARVGALNSERLGENLVALCRTVETMLRQVEEAGGRYELSGFDLTAEITASGEIRLVGAASAEVKGGVVLRFARRTAAE